MIRLILQVILFWFITVFVTQDHRLNWTSFIIWIVFAHVLGGVTGVLLNDVLPGWPAAVGSLLVLSGILAAVLYFKFGFDKPRELAMVIAVYFGVTILVDIVLMLFFTNLQAGIDEAFEQGRLLTSLSQSWMG